ncbi:hypothetical protein ACFL1K_01535 [Candidatus Omnitrophota bacterium]
MKNVTVRLKISDIIIRMQSKFRLKPYTKKEERQRIPERFKNFFYHGRARPQIRIKVKIVDQLPKVQNAKPIFITRHFQDGNENWRLLKKRDSYIYKSPLKSKQQLMLVNKNFDRVTAYLIPKDEKGKAWRPDDLIYDFIQVLLISYLALHKKGIIVHGIGLKDINGRGLLFAGKSGAGKSTTARIWNRFSRAMILNDDRIIVRRLNGRYFIYGCPWYGDFSDYLYSKMEAAPLERLFFIHHSPNNNTRQISQKAAFNQLYPALFPTFWDKQNLENIVSFCQDLLKEVNCYNLGFLNNKKIISFVRKL